MQTLNEAFLVVLRDDKDQLWQPWSQPFDALRDEFSRREQPVPATLRPFDFYRVRLLVAPPLFVHDQRKEDVVNVVGAVIDGRMRSEAVLQSLIELCAKVRTAQDGYYRLVGFYVILVRPKGNVRQEQEFTAYQLRILEQVGLALGQPPQLLAVDHDDETFLQSVASLTRNLALRVRERR